MDIIGFTLLRNGIKYDYPFMESLSSLSKVTQKIFLALGDSEDLTEEELQKNSELYSHLNIIHTIWDENLRQGGLILSEQTNVALTALRNKYKSGWAIYLQTDEVISDEDYERIIEDIKAADSLGCDAISFRYFHFWQTYDQIAIKKNWYPQEIRAIKIDSNIWSAGDAQSFTGVTHIYNSDVIIYHYGHVRDPEKYKLKRLDFHHWWHNDTEIEKIEKKANKKDANQPTLKFLGPHPKEMHHRIFKYSPPCKKKGVNILCTPDTQIPSHIIDRIYVDEVKIINQPNQQNPDFPTISLRSNWYDRIRFRDNIPYKMKSKLARPWPLITLLKLKLAKKGIYIK